MILGTTSVASGTFSLDAAGAVTQSGALTAASSGDASGALNLGTQTNAVVKQECQTRVS